MEPFIRLASIPSSQWTDLNAFLTSVISRSSYLVRKWLLHSKWNLSDIFDISVSFLSFFLLFERKNKSKILLFLTFLLVQYFQQIRTRGNDELIIAINRDDQDLFPFWFEYHRWVGFQCSMVRWKSRTHGSSSIIVSRKATRMDQISQP